MISGVDLVYLCTTKKVCSFPENDQSTPVSVRHRTLCQSCKYLEMFRDSYIHMDAVRTDQIFERPRLWNCIHANWVLCLDGLWKCCSAGKTSMYRTNTDSKWPLWIVYTSFQSPHAVCNVRGWFLKSSLQSNGFCCTFVFISARRCSRLV